MSTAPIPSFRAITAPYAVLSSLTYAQSALGGNFLPVLGGETTNLVTFRVYNNYLGVMGTASMDNVMITVFDDVGVHSSTKSVVTQSWLRVYETGFGEAGSAPGSYTQYLGTDTAVGQAGGSSYQPEIGSSGTTWPSIRAGTDTNGVGFIEFASYVETPENLGFANYTFAISMTYDWQS